MNRKSQIISLALSLIAIVLLIVNLVQITLLTKKVEILSGTENKSVETSAISSDSSLEKQDEGTSKRADLELRDIDTPYGTLKFPAEFYEYLKIEKNKGTPQTFTFICDMNEIKEELFTISYGDDSAKTILGSVVKDGEKISVGITINDKLIRDDSWTDEEYYVVCSMQEGINNIIESIRENDNFEPRD